MMDCHGQVYEGSTAVFRHTGCDQISMQGYVDAGLQEADRQFEDQPPSMEALFFTFGIELVGSVD